MYNHLFTCFHLYTVQLHHQVSQVKYRNERIQMRLRKHYPTIDRFDFLYEGHPGCRRAG